MRRVRIHHLALRTRKRRAVVRFYRDILGLPLIEETARSTWLDAAGAIVMIERRAPGEPEVPRNSLELVAFAVTAAEHAALRARLLRHRVAIEASTEFTSYFRDPDGRRVALSHFRRARRRTM